MDLQTLRVYGLLVLGGVGVILLGGWAHYRHPPKLPPPPPAEQPLGAPIVSTTHGYRTILGEDAQRFGVQAPLEAMLEPFQYAVEFEGSHRLAGKDGLTTERLEIHARIERQWATLGGSQAYRPEQFILTIKNRTPRHLAYRVTTRVPDKKFCRSTAAIVHNAIALRPNEEVMRAECLWGRNFFVEIQKVETIELPPLSYYYVSRLHPAHVLYDERTSEGHQPPIGRPCDLLPWREIQSGAETREVSWPDIIDFYARHGCDEYTFFRGYRRRTARTEPLPAANPTADTRSAKP